MVARGENVPVLARRCLDKTRCRTPGFSGHVDGRLIQRQPFRAPPGTAHNRLLGTPITGSPAAATPLPDFRLRTVALLELLARAAPAGVVAADLVPLGDGSGRGRDGAAAREEAARGDRSAVPTPVGQRSRADRLRARDLVVLVRQPCRLGRLGLLQAL